MSNDNSQSPRRRPVDVLFGEEIELKSKSAVTDAQAPSAQPPGYMVEAPRPVIPLRPPPPEFPNDWRATTPPEVVTIFETLTLSAPTSENVAPPPIPLMTEPPQAQAIAEAVTFTVSERVEATEAPSASTTEAAPLVPLSAPTVATANPAAAISPAPFYGQTELLELSQFVDQLYQNVAAEASDSASLNAECLAKLNTARAAIEQNEYATAETAAEWVKARLLLARASRAAARATNTRLTLVWLIVALSGGIVLFLLPFIARLAPAIIPLLRGMGMGITGAAVAALLQLTRQINARALESDMSLRFGIAPFVGAVCGAVLYLLSLLGIFAAPGALGIPGEPWLMYLGAFFASLFSASVIDFLSARFAAKPDSKTRNP